MNTKRFSKQNVLEMLFKMQDYNCKLMDAVKNGTTPDDEKHFIENDKNYQLGVANTLEIIIGSIQDNNL